MIIDYFFCINEDHELYRAYFKHKENEDAVREVFNKLKALAGIETDIFLPSNKRIALCSTPADLTKFRTQFTSEKKGSWDEFKIRSRVNLLWLQLLKESRVTVEPCLEEMFYLPHKRINHWNIFALDGKVYLRHTTDVKYDAPAGFVEISNREYLDKTYQGR